MNAADLYSQIRAATRTALEQAFTDLREDHGDENFYVFALYTTGDADYAMATANSEQGLLRVAAENGNRPEAAERLRWSPCDWPYHGVGGRYFGAVGGLLEQASALEFADEDEAELHLQNVLQALTQGLHDLELCGFFGQGKSRAAVTLLLMMGDQSEPLLLESARTLNPPEVADAFVKRFERPTAGTFTEIGSRKCYEIAGLGLSSDGRTLAAAGDDHLFVFALPRGDEVFKKRTGKYLTAHFSMWGVALAPDGDQLAIGWQSGFNADGGVERWSLSRQQKLPDLPIVRGGVYAVAYSPDSRLLAAGGADRTIRLWDAATGALLHELGGHPGTIQFLQFSSRGWLASTDRDHSIRLWDPDSGQELRQLTDTGDTIGFTPDGELLAVASGWARKKDQDDTLRFWNVMTGEKTRTLSGVIPPAHAIAFSLDGRLLAVGSDHTVQLWDVAAGQFLETLTPNYERIADVAFVSNTGPVAVVGCGHSRLPLLLWDIRGSLESRCS